MQEVSSLYREIISGNHTVETRVAIGDTDVLVTRQGDYITFGGRRILVAATGADGGYDESVLSEVSTSGALFSSNEPEVGACVSREVNIKMLKPSGNISGMERISIYSRVTDGQRYSEWLPQGVFYLDSAEEAAGDGDVRWIEIHGYDAMMFAEQDFPLITTLKWPAKDIDVVRLIAGCMGIAVDDRTWEIMDKEYLVQYSTYSLREYLGYIAAMYGGCFTINERGELRLVCFWDIPKETKYLIDNSGNAITFGGERILV